MVWVIFGSIDAMIIWWLITEIRKPLYRFQTSGGDFGTPRLLYQSNRPTKLERQIEKICEWQRKQV